MKILKRVAVGFGVYFFFGTVITYTVGLTTMAVVLCLVLAVWSAASVDL